MDLIVEARAVRKIYRTGTNVEALRGVDLTVARGEMVAIMGPSGSGKTTLLNCLAGLERIDGGEVLIDGRSMADLDDDDRTDYRARNMGFVFQAFNLLPVLTAAENTEIPLLLLGERPKEARARAIETLADVGLADRADHRPDQLSGGEQQRVAVARALVHRPAVVWADEPTGNLDTESTEAVMDLLRRLNREGQTIVLVTHSEEVARSAVRIVRMRDGRIESRPPAEVHAAWGREVQTEMDVHPAAGIEEPSEWDAVGHPADLGTVGAPWALDPGRDRREDGPGSDGDPPAALEPEASQPGPEDEPTGTRP